VFYVKLIAVKNAKVTVYETLPANQNRIITRKDTMSTSVSSCFKNGLQITLRYYNNVAEKRKKTIPYTGNKEVWGLKGNVKKNSTERVRLHRQKMKNDGFKSIYISITPEHKIIMQNLCQNMKVSQAFLVSYLLDCAVERVLPKIDGPFAG
jgi:hypothetical protein